MAYILSDYTPSFAETFEMLDGGHDSGVFIGIAPAGRPALTRMLSNVIFRGERKRDQRQNENNTYGLANTAWQRPGLTYRPSRAQAAACYSVALRLQPDARGRRTARGGLLGQRTKGRVSES
jgi:hypothetical protein